LRCGEGCGREKIEAVVRLVLLYDRFVDAMSFFASVVVACASLPARSKQVRGLGDGFACEVFARVRCCSPLKD
jgi:hypothetical protein